MKNCLLLALLILSLLVDLSGPILCASLAAIDAAGVVAAFPSARA